MTAKVPAGVSFNRNAPTRVPATVVGIVSSAWRRSGRSCREPYTLARYPGHTATELVKLAGFGGSPIASSAGNVTSDPPPATALTVPAASPAPSNSPTFERFIALSARLRCRCGRDRTASIQARHRRVPGDQEPGEDRVGDGTDEQTEAYRHS